MTPSLTNFLLSLAVGALFIVIPVSVVLSLVSQKDRVIRRP